MGSWAHQKSAYRDRVDEIPFGGYNKIHQTKDDYDHMDTP